MNTELSPQHQLLKAIAKSSLMDIYEAIRLGGNWLEPMNAEDQALFLGFYYPQNTPDHKRMMEALNEGMTPFHALLINPSRIYSGHGDATSSFKELVETALETIPLKSLQALPSGNSALHSALSAKKWFNNKLISKIIRRMNPQDLDTVYLGLTPFLKSWTVDRVMTGFELIKMPQVNRHAVQEKTLKSAVHLAIEYIDANYSNGNSQQKRVVKKLIALGVNPHHQDHEGNTFFHRDPSTFYGNPKEFDLDFTILNYEGKSFINGKSWFHVEKYYKARPDLDWEYLLMHAPKFTYAIQHAHIPKENLEGLALKAWSEKIELQKERFASHEPQEVSQVSSYRPRRF